MSQAGKGNLGNSIRQFFRLPGTRDLGVALAIGLAVSVITMGMLAPKSWQLGTQIIGGKDAAYDFWAFAQGIRKWSSFSLLQYFDGNIYFPLSGTVGLGEHFFLPSLLALPLKVATGSIQVTYNLVLILLFGLNAAAFAFAVRLMGAPWVIGSFGALIFSINCFRWQSLGQLETLMSFFFPCLIVLFERMQRFYSPRRFIVFLAAILVVAISTRIAFLMIIPAVVCSLIIVAERFFKDQVYLKQAGPWLLAWFVLLVIISRPYALAQGWFDLQSTSSALRGFSNKWTSIFDQRDHLKIPGLLLSKVHLQTNGALFFGVTEWLVILSSSLLAIRGFYLRRLTPRSPEGAFILGCYFLMIVYLLASMGPNGDGEVFGFNTYALLSYLPGFSTLLSPNLLSIVVHFFVALLGVLLWSTEYRLAGAGRQKAIRTAVAVLAVLHLGEMYPSSHQSDGSVAVEREVLSLRKFLKSNDPKGAIAVIPSLEEVPNGEYLPAVLDNSFLNGMSPADKSGPSAFEEMVRPRLLNCANPNCLELLRQLGAKYILTRQDAKEAKANVAALERIPGLKRVFDETPWIVFEVEETSNWKKLVNGNQGFLKRLQPWKTSTCYPPKDVRVSSHSDKNQLAHDGMFGTMWQSEQEQEKAESWVEIEIPDELRTGDALIEFESGFDGSIQNAVFARQIAVARVSEKVSTPIFGAMSRVSLKEPYRTSEQIFVPAGSSPDQSTIRISAQQVPRIKAVWGIGEIKVCKLAGG